MRRPLCNCTLISAVFIWPINVTSHRSKAMSGGLSREKVSALAHTPSLFEKQEVGITQAFTMTLVLPFLTLVTLIFMLCPIETEHFLRRTQIFICSYEASWMFTHWLVTMKLRFFLPNKMPVKFKSISFEKNISENIQSRCVYSEVLSLKHRKIMETVWGGRFPLRSRASFKASLFWASPKISWVRLKVECLEGRFMRGLEHVW